MITSLGYGTYMFFGSLMILMGIWAYFFVPETKGKTLEQMEELFGAPTATASAALKSDEEKPTGMVHIEQTDEPKGNRSRIARVLSA